LNGSTAIRWGRISMTLARSLSPYAFRGNGKSEPAAMSLSSETVQQRLGELL
jgi:hypothetical protein